MMSPRKELIRTIYLYLVTLAGVIMTVIASVGLVKLGLETWVFPLATEGQYGYYGRVPPEPYFLNKSVDSAAVTTGTVALSPADQQVFEQWKQDYQTWREEEKNKDWAAIERQRRFVDNFALLLGGLALLFSHGYIIRRDKKQQP